MKKYFALILALIMVLSFAACGETEEVEEVDTERETVISAVRARAIVTMNFTYEITGLPHVTTPTVEEVSEDHWEVSGKITVTDKYGDSYTCTYDAVVEYDSSADDANVVDFDHTTPRKD